VLTTDQKGNIAEHAVVYHATKLGIDVYRPVGEGGRYDMLFDLDSSAFNVNRGRGTETSSSSGVTPLDPIGTGLVRRVYSPDEIDAFAVCTARRPTAALPSL